METHEREARIRQAVTGIAHLIDARRWAELRDIYDDEVEVDYTSLFGGDVQRLRAEALIETWRTRLSGVDATQHLLGPIDVELAGDKAVAECHVRGCHVLHDAPGGPEWMVAGHWVIRFAERGGEWKATGMTLQTFYQTGNRRLLELAAAR